MDHYCCKKCGLAYSGCRCPENIDLNREQMIQRITELELIASFAQDVVDYWPKMSIRTINVMSSRMADLKETLSNVKCKD